MGAPKNLNEFQQKAVESAPARPLLIVAGAGTGKTATLTSRIGYFIKNGVAPGSILAVTFTNKAAKEMGERVASILGPGGLKGGAPQIGTFHSFGARILRAHAKLLDRTADFVIFDDHDSFALIKRILKELDRKKDSAAAYASAIAAFKNDGEEPDKPIVRAVLQKYEDTLLRSNAFDFDDLLSKSLLVLRRHPAVLGKYRSRFTHILVDEYQDINNVQHDLIDLLAGGGASISVVGDAEQTIYGWRGSNIEIFLKFPEKWADSEMVTLTQNYRSTKNILRAASGVIRENIYDTKVQRATDLWTENPEGDPVVIRESANEDDEAWWIAETIALDPETETAVLYRTNAQSRALEQALLVHRIPYVVYGGLKFYERREIRDVVAGLRLALNPDDEVSRDRLEKAFSKRMVRELLSAFAAQGPSAPVARIDVFLRTTDYFGYMDRYLTNPRDRRENIEELIHFASRFQDLPPLLEEVALLQATDALTKEKREGAVNLMTVHLAKGLEFDRVFVAGVSEGLLPHARSLDTAAAIQEERRLMYVAMTRARKNLYLGFYGMPSRFLGEIPEEAVRFENPEGRVSPADFRDQEYEESYITLD